MREREGGMRPLSDSISLVVTRAVIKLSVEVCKLFTRYQPTNVPNIRALKSAFAVFNSCGQNLY